MTTTPDRAGPGTASAQDGRGLLPPDAPAVRPRRHPGREVVAALFAENRYTVAEAARLAGVSVVTAWRVASELGYRPPADAIRAGRAQGGSNAAGQRGHNDLHARVMAAIQADPGRSNADIARDLGIHRHTVRKIARRAGLPPRHQDDVRRVPAAKAPARVREASGTPSSVYAVMALSGRGRTDAWRQNQAAAVAHANRTARLPPVRDDEAAELVAQFLAKRPATQCPTYGCGGGNAGEGFGAWRKVL